MKASGRFSIGACLTLTTLLLLPTSGSSTQGNPGPIFADRFEVPRYSVGGVLEGLLSGSSLQLRLEASGTQDLSLADNGPFSFPLPVAEGTVFQVSVLQAPANQNCGVNPVDGVVTGPVADIGVSCVGGDRLIWDQGAWDGENWN